MGYGVSYGRDYFEDEDKRMAIISNNTFVRL